MLIRELREDEHSQYNAAVEHPLQSWEWGEFRKKTGVQVERIGFFDNGKLVRAMQITFHDIPVLGRKLGYFPKGPMPDEEQLSILEQLGKKHNAVFIKMEPNIAQPLGTPSAHDTIAKFLVDHKAEPGRPLFTKYTFQLDLTKSEDKLLEQLNSKTRYNVKLAQKKGVQIFENTSAEGMEQYITILEETTKRQGFYAHSPAYFRTLWKSLGDSGNVRIFNAVYENTVVASWVMFIFNGVLYYPYGASSNLYRDVMASNLLMWEMIIFGKNNGCHTFDMWGALGPDASEKDPFFGFHRFKKGYGATLMEFLGTYDLVLDPLNYRIFRIAEELRWKWLRLRAKLKF
jgi:lipid II:glycine glycyltransferase (peptidoglycan interpeptide bridge formation enzyme)